MFADWSCTVLVHNAVEKIAYFKNLKENPSPDCFGVFPLASIPLPRPHFAPPPYSPLSLVFLLTSFLQYFCLEREKEKYFQTLS